MSSVRLVYFMNHLDLFVMFLMCLTQCCRFQAYYRQGVALQCLGRHADALGAFASALAQDDKSPQLLTSLTEAAMKSPLRGKYSIIKLVCLGLSIIKIFQASYRKCFRLSLQIFPFSFVRCKG